MTWKKVCPVGDIQEDAIAEFDIDGTKIAVVRAGEDLFAYPLRCPHSNGTCEREYPPATRRSTCSSTRSRSTMANSMSI